jgi:two-component system response regulator
MPEAVKSGQRPIVLVLEDAEPDAYIIDKAVRNLGLDVEVVIERNIPAARARLMTALENPRRLPALVIVDLLLPEGNGLDLVEWARTQPHLEGMRFVVVSNFADCETIRRAYGAGVHSFVPKESIFSDPGVAEAIARYWLNLNAALSTR